MLSAFEVNIVMIMGAFEMALFPDCYQTHDSFSQEPSRQQQTFWKSFQPLEGHP